MANILDLETLFSKNKKTIRLRTLSNRKCVMNTTWAVVKIRPEKKLGLYGIWTHAVCDTSAALY